MIVTFYIAGTLAIAASLGTVLARDPLRAALSLVLCLLSLAVLYVTLSAHFVAAIQIIVYAGAIMVFFVLVIMMLDPGERKAGGSRLLWAVLGLAVSGVLLALLLEPISVIPEYGGEVSRGFGTTEAIGGAVFRHYVLPFEVLSGLLLAAMIGTVILARKKERGEGVA